MQVDVEEYVASFCPELMEAAAAWYNGVSFAAILKLNDFFEARPFTLLVGCYILPSFMDAHKSFGVSTLLSLAFTIKKKGGICHHQA